MDTRWKVGPLVWIETELTVVEGGEKAKGRDLSNRWRGGSSVGIQSKPVRRLQATSDISDELLRGMGPGSGKNGR